MDPFCEQTFHDPEELAKHVVEAHTRLPLLCDFFGGYLSAP
jgi:hypothetical protein